MRKPEINAALRKLAEEHLSPTETERNFVSKVYASIQSVLGEKNCLQIGSYPRFTAVTPLHDLDVLYVLGAQGGDTSSASKALRNLQQTLQRDYKNPTRYTFEISLQTHSISIAFMEGEEEVFAVDIVPAFISGTNEFGEATYLVPEIFSKNHRAKMRRYEELAERRQAMAWINSDPRGYIYVARDVNDANPDFRKAVKIAKAWKQACCEASKSFKLKSFHLEQVITGYFRANRSIDLFDAVFRFFCDIPSLLVKPMIPDRADPSRMIDAYVADLTPLERQAVIQARDHFLIQLENLSGSSDVLNLLKAGFRERVGTAESFLFDQRIPVLIENDTILRIEGFVLVRDGFRSFFLDTRGLISIDRRIRFSVVRAAPSVDLYKWKVRNDDSSPQPRGEITDHSTLSNPERTAYPGKHFVECYAIRGRVCIARARQNVELQR
jgi:adenylyl/guanylyl cyclase-like protein with sensor domain